MTCVIVKELNWLAAVVRSAPVVKRVRVRLTCQSEVHRLTSRYCFPCQNKFECPGNVTPTRTPVSSCLAMDCPRRLQILGCTRSTAGVGVNCTAAGRMLKLASPPCTRAMEWILKQLTLFLPNWTCRVRIRTTTTLNQTGHRSHAAAAPSKSYPAKQRDVQLLGLSMGSWVVKKGVECLCWRLCLQAQIRYQNVRAFIRKSCKLVADAQRQLKMASEKRLRQCTDTPREEATGITCAACLFDSRPLASEKWKHEIVDSTAAAQEEIDCCKQECLRAWASTRPRPRADFGFRILRFVAPLPRTPQASPDFLQLLCSRHTAARWHKLRSGLPRIRCSEGARGLQA